jgi:putative peptidoglycan lipid II flippase
VAGAALQMAVQLPSVFSLLRHPRFLPDFGYAPVRDVVKNFLPVFVSRGVVQISGFIDVRIASAIVGTGPVTLLGYAQTIYLLPISLFGMAISAAELPELARVGGGDSSAFERLRARLNAAIPRVAFFCVPSALGFLFLGEAIAGVLLQHGKFSQTDSFRTWVILAGSAVGLVASAIARLYSSTFYAIRDTRTPLRYALIRVVLTGVLGYLFAFPLPRLLGLPAWTGAAGLTASAGIAGWVEFYLLRRALASRIGPTGMSRLALLRFWGAGLLAGVVGWGVMHAMDPRHNMIRGISAMLAFAAVYGLTTLALGVPEAKAIVARFRR